MQNQFRITNNTKSLISHLSLKIDFKNKQACCHLPWRSSGFLVNLCVPG